MKNSIKTDQSAPPASLWRRKFVRAASQVRPLLNTILIRFSTIPDIAIFDPSVFPWIKELEAHYEDIKNELEKLLASQSDIPPLAEISPDHRRISRDNLWKSFFLWGYGVKVPENCRLAPKTAKLVERIPGLQTALFSILEPGAAIKNHRGATKAIIACHLPLVVPADTYNCWIHINEQTYYWTEGKAFIFDDTYLHKVKNMTSERRILLLLQVERPLRFPGTILGRLVLLALRLSPFVQDTKRNIKAWGKNAPNA